MTEHPLPNYNDINPDLPKYNEILPELLNNNETIKISTINKIIEKIIIILWSISTLFIIFAPKQIKNWNLYNFFRPFGQCPLLAILVMFIMFPISVCIKELIILLFMSEDFCEKKNVLRQIIKNIISPLCTFACPVSDFSCNNSNIIINIGIWIGHHFPLGSLIGFPIYIIGKLLEYITELYYFSNFLQNFRIDFKIIKFRIKLRWNKNSILISKEEAAKIYYKYVTYQKHLVIINSNKDIYNNKLAKLILSSIEYRNTYPIFKDINKLTYNTDNITESKHKIRSLIFT